MHRLAAAVIALVAWAGLVVQFAATFGQTGSIADTIWILLRFFTVITNLLVISVVVKSPYGVSTKFVDNDGSSDSAGGKFTRPL